MSDSPSLREATVQDIQLELIRRRRFNDFDGEVVYVSLLKHRSLWTAVLMDRPGIPDYVEQTHLLIGGLIKLRDLPQNYWNADTLFILTPSRGDAHELARIAEEEEWGSGIQIHDDLEETDQAFGNGPTEIWIAFYVVGLKHRCFASGVLESRASCNTTRSLNRARNCSPVLVSGRTNAAEIGAATVRTK